MSTEVSKEHLQSRGGIMQGQQQLPIHQQGSGVGGGSGSGVHQTSAGMKQTGREQKDVLMESAEHAAHQVKKTSEQLLDMACDACHNWRHYPKLLTGLLLLTTFLLGAGSLAAVQRLGVIGGGHQNFVSQHWNRETADAHHALDVVLDHLANPHYYQTEKSESYLNKARKSLFSLFDMGGKSKGKSGREYVERKGRDMYEDVRDTGRGVYDKAADLKDDLAYKTRRSVDWVKDSTEDLSHNVGSKISNLASGLKSTFVGDHDHDDDSGYMRRKSRSSSSSIWPSWLGGGSDSDHPSYRSRSRKGESSFMHRGESDEDELGMAADKLRHVVRSAERDNQ